VRVLEKLQETQQQRHQAGEQAREQSDLDEVAQRSDVRDGALGRK
jgi:flagellar biosynthesis chaperone FliJ